jgi:hypothetical protein
VTRTCTVCAHKQRRTIDRALVVRQSYRDIAGRFSLARSSLSRHQQEHLPALLARAYAAEQEAEASDLLDQVRMLRNKALQLLVAAERSGDYRTALAGVREARGCLELLAEVEGRINRQPTFNVTLSAEWVEIRGAIMDELQDVPELRARVAARLRLLPGSA